MRQTALRHSPAAQYGSSGLRHRSEMGIGRVATDSDPNVNHTRVRINWPDIPASDRWHRIGFKKAVQAHSRVSRAGTRQTPSQAFRRCELCRRVSPPEPCRRGCPAGASNRPASAAQPAVRAERMAVEVSRKRRTQVQAREAHERLAGVEAGERHIRREWEMGEGQRGQAGVEASAPRLPGMQGMPRISGCLRNGSHPSSRRRQIASPRARTCSSGCRGRSPRRGLCPLSNRSRGCPARRGLEPPGPRRSRAPR
jgi:hypothetical protein